MNINEYTLTIIRRFPNLTIIHQVEKGEAIWASKGRSIYHKHNDRWRKFARFPFSFPRDIFGFFRSTARIMRSDKCNIYQNSRGKVIGIRDGCVYSIANNGKLRFLFKIHGDCILNNSICEDDEGWCYFGEYFMNPKRIPVNIFKVSPDIETWKKAYTFPKNQIRHVHGVYRDPFEKETFWATVGDYQNECYLLKSRDRFKTFEQFGDGNQNWRAVNLFFTEDYICWISDSNLQQNYAYRMSRHTGKLEKGQKIENSGWYGCTSQEGIHFAFTTVESGSAITSNFSQVLISNDAFLWKEIHKFKKDIWRPMKLFKYGVIIPPSGMQRLDNFYLSGEGLVGFDGISILAKISPGLLT